MIPRVYASVGKPVRFKGYAYDFGHAVGAIQFSLDGGKHWTTYETTKTNDYQNVSWVFEYVPEREGQYLLKVRSVNDEGKEGCEATAELVVRQGSESYE